MTSFLPFTSTQELIWTCVTLFSASFLLFPAILFFVMKLYRKVGLMDQPHKYPHEKRKTPLPLEVGAALYINFAAIALIF
jgi:UDP-N-acetylmuramyl pentapeptide phosphotransferase/UDP-N-acetylglucosamine-1-phosphate transferase